MVIFMSTPKLLQYADDTTAVLKNQRSVKEFISLITKFGEISGLKINTQKTEALWLGDVPPFKLPNNIKWSNKPLKVLGAYVGWNLQEANRLTISKKIIDMRKMLFFLETQEINSEWQSAYPEKLSNFPDHTPGKLTSISR